MAPALIVEQLDQRGTVRSRVRLDAFPATIGRAYSNDVILDDPYVCPRHVRIAPDEQGSLVAEDLQSVNGLREIVRTNGRARVGEPVGHVPVRAGTLLRVGQTVLRFCDPDQPVPRTLRERAHGRGLRRHLTPMRVSVATCATAFGAFAANMYVGSYHGPSAADILGGSLGIMALLGAWSGVWALVGRVVSHSWRYLSHLALASAAAVGFMLLATATEWLVFFFPATSADALEFAVGTVLATALLAGHLAVAASMSPRRRWAAAAAVSGGVIALVALVALLDDDDDSEFTSDMSYPAVVKPVDPNWLRSVSVDEFMRAAAPLKGKVDSLAAKG